MDSTTRAASPVVMSEKSGREQIRSEFHSVVIQPERRTSATASMSASEMRGLLNGRNGTSIGCSSETTGRPVSVPGTEKGVMVLGSLMPEGEAGLLSDQSIARAIPIEAKIGNHSHSMVPGGLEVTS